MVFLNIKNKLHRHFTECVVNTNFHHTSLNTYFDEEDTFIPFLVSEVVNIDNILVKLTAIFDISKENMNVDLAVNKNIGCTGEASLANTFSNKNGEKFLNSIKNKDSFLNHPLFVGIKPNAYSITYAGENSEDLSKELNTLTKSAFFLRNTSNSFIEIIFPILLVNDFNIEEKERSNGSVLCSHATIALPVFLGNRRYWSHIHIITKNGFDGFVENFYSAKQLIQTQKELISDIFRGIEQSDV